MKLYNKVLSILVVGAITASTAWAFDYNNMINLSGKQRMLTQKMTKEAMLVALDINKEDNIASLQKTRDLFDKTLKGLKDGDADLKLDKTKKPKILKQLGKVDALWSDFDKEISSILSSRAVTKEEVEKIATINLPLLKEMNKAVKFYEADAAGAGTNPALAKAINLAGKQRMLTQKMSKEFMLVAYGYNVDANKEALSKTVGLFDKTLNGLINGDENMGLSAAPNDDIKAQLEKVKKMWAAFKINIEGEISADNKQAVADNNLPLLKEMNKAVQMFSEL